MEPTYYESARGIEISHDRMVEELRLHGMEHPNLEEAIEQLHRDLGDHPTYMAGDVLNWLGY